MHFQYEVDYQLLERHNSAMEFILLTVEVRIPDDEPGFRHFVAGVKAEYLLRADAEVTYSGGTIYVKENEVLNAGQASELFNTSFKISKFRWTMLFGI